jgi:hypothetical protein
MEHLESGAIALRAGVPIIVLLVTLSLCVELPAQGLGGMKPIYSRHPHPMATLFTVSE